MKEKGIGTAVIVVAVIIIAAAAGGGYMVISGGESVQGLVSNKLQPSIGDEWEYRMTTENNMVMMMDMKVEDLQTVSFGDHNAEAYVVTGALAIEDFGGTEDALPSGASMSLKEGSMTMYTPENALHGSTKMEMNLTISGSFQGESFTMTIESTETTEVISGEKPDIVNVGDSWSKTEKTITDETETWTAGGTSQPETSHSESTNTANYEVVGTETVTVEAGTFDTYKVKKTTVGSDNYTINYYTSETKLPVKSIDYSNSKTTRLMELISYDVE